MLASSVHMWRHLSRLQRYLIPSRVTPSLSIQSNTLFTRAFLRLRGLQILPISSRDETTCIRFVATVNAVEHQLKSSRHGYHYHSGQDHKHRQSHTSSATASTISVIPMLGVGLLLCSSSRQGNGILQLFLIYYPSSLPLSLLSSTLDGGWKFTRAAREENIQTMKKLLKSGVDINCRHPLGWTALHTAVINTNWPVIEFLIKNGVDINSKDEFSSAPRMAAQERVNSTQGMHSSIMLKLDS